MMNYRGEQSNGQYRDGPAGPWDGKARAVIDNIDLYRSAKDDTTIIGVALAEVVVAEIRKVKAENNQLRGASAGVEREKRRQAYAAGRKRK